MLCRRRSLHRMLVVTSDLFQKNADNVYLGVVPAVYERWFGLKSFVTDPLPKTSPIVRRTAVGAGTVVMLHKDVSLADWQALAAELGINSA